MAHVDRLVTGSAAHGEGQHPAKRFAWGRLFALLATVGLWIGVINAGKGFQHFLN